MPGHKGIKCDTACTDGQWDADCRTPCGFCYNGTVCNKTSGKCPFTEGNPLCSAGYRYTDTTCRIPCADRQWGVNCQTPCGFCYNGTVCNKTSGECSVTEGNLPCSPGYRYTDTTCRTPCENGTWGDNCSVDCSENCKSGGCDFVTGACLGVCQLGFTGHRCETGV
ncbi:multiple epidermal growth factor-like domains protein 10 [Liolophura sinensis]|uniref:multiple epidermal growth factor-like domains protein 10 n=1 Tax=Liolophura sinensis TaxID=3198878 RepID=UPI003158F6E9